MRRCQMKRALIKIFYWFVQKHICVQLENFQSIHYVNGIA